jgi:hypothetical protein
MLDENFMVLRSLTCPFERFFKAEEAPKPRRKEKKQGDDVKRAAVKKEKEPPKEPKPTHNATIPALCKQTVAKLRAAHPDITIHKLARDSGLPTSKFVIGNGGGCTNWQLLGQCNNAECKYKHTVPTVTDARQKEVNTALNDAIKAMAKDKA